MKLIKIAVVIFAALALCTRVQAALPLVAVHDSELTRALASLPASATTPRGAGTTGFEWWLTAWHYHVMPESVKEALFSDGTPFAVVSDADITNGALLDANGAPKYPIVISLASEAIRDDEIAPLLNYVNAGGTLFVGSSSFTRTTTGATRGDFAIANAMGLHMVNPSLNSWIANYTFSKQLDHRLVAHIPSGALTWRMPWSAEEISWGIYPHSTYPAGPHPIWYVRATDAQVIAQNDTSPYLLTKAYGKGRFIYHAGIEPLMGDGGWAPGMYAYGIFREAIQWAFESLNQPVPRISPWPYPYDSAFNVRHDFENYQDMINGIEASAQSEYAAGAKGDYYFCTGALRVDMGNSSATIASLRRAVTNYNASIGPHNGGLRNPNATTLANTNYDYWHWGLDEALDVTPSGYASGKAYALTSLGNAFGDVEGWLAGLTNANGLRIWVSPYFNATREDSLDILSQLKVSVAGEQKLTPFPHWTLSTQTSGKRYPFLTLPVSDWYIGTSIAQSIEYHSSTTLHAAVDYYYNLGALVNIYAHGSSSSGLENDYVLYCAAKPRIWAANAADVYDWWWRRSGVQISPTLVTNANQTIVTLAITGAIDPQTAVEVWIPQPGFSALEVRCNGVLATSSQFRTSGQRVRVLAGTTVSSVEVRYTLPTTATNDAYTVAAGQTLTVPDPGVLANDTGLAPLTAALISGPANGTLNLNASGGFTYTPAAGFSGTDRFVYQEISSSSNPGYGTVTLTVTPTSTVIFSDDFTQNVLTPWVNAAGTWTASGGILQGSSPTNNYGVAQYSGTWSDYSVQAQIQFPSGGFGGGLSGRFNASTGERYSAWIYPEGSAGGSSVLKLVKFRSLTAWSGTPMMQVSLPSVGTAWHTLKLTFQGARILVSYDGTQMIDVTDSSFDSRAPYASGGITAELYTYNTAYKMNVDNVVVSSLTPVNQPPVANNDAYSVVSGTTLTVTGPGVLSNDTDANGNSLTAVLATGPTHGTLNLNANGGFTYTPIASFSGTDSFTYMANNSQANSGVATVNITVTAPVNQPPVVSLTSPASGTTFTDPATVTLTASASDTDGSISKVEFYNGATKLGESAATPFTFTWSSVASGTYSLTARAYDNLGASATSAAVSITVNPSTSVYFSDDFTQNVLAPWVNAAGTWTVSNGVLQGSSPTNNYGVAQYSGAWGDYSVQAQIQFPSGGFGGGLSGRFNASTGERYSAWIYPEGSAGGSSVLKLVKFRSLTAWSGTPMMQVSLPSVGTAWHTLKLTFQGARILVSYDGTQMIDVTDSSFDSRAPYASGGITAELWTYNTAYKMNVDNVVVSSIGN